MKAVSLTILGMALAVTACTTMTPEERRAADEAECRSYGFNKRNDAFAECLQRLDLDRRAARREQRASFDNWDRPLVVYRTVPVRVRAK
jgi:hypothetical protein